MLNIKLDTNKSAYRDPHDRDSADMHQIAASVRRIADEIQDGHTKGRICDINDTKVGEWSLAE